MIPASMMIYILDDNGKIKLFVRMFLYFLAATFFSVGLGLNFEDDGLRHLSFANNSDIMLNWGNVYPMSLFESYGTYDPWSFWHAFLKFIIGISSFENAHIVVNLMSIFILLTLVDLILNIEMRRYKNTIVLITLILMTFISVRYINLRPDLISGFYVMGVYLIFNINSPHRKSIALLILSLLYIQTYYLFFVYTLAASMFMFMVKDYKNMSVLFLSTVFGFIYYYLNFGEESLVVVKNVLLDEELREGLFVGEGVPIYSVLLLVNMKVIVVVYSILMLSIKFFFQEFLIKHKLFTFVLTLSLLWVSQGRYEELFRPLIYILIISTAINIKKTYVRKIFVKLLKYFTIFHKEFSKSNKNISFVLIFTVFLAFEFGVNVKNQEEEKQVESKELLAFFKSKEFNNSTIVFNTLGKQNYFSLYANPTIKNIPSCSIGWKDGSSDQKSLYLKLIKREITFEELERFAIQSKADYLILQLPINKNVDINFNNKNIKSLKILKFYKEYIVISVGKN